METAVILLSLMVTGGLSASNPVVYNVHTIQQVLKAIVVSLVNCSELFAENVKLQNMVASLENKYKLVFKELMSVKAELAAHINSTVVQSGNRHVTRTYQHKGGECPPGFTAWNSNCYKLVVNQNLALNWITAFGRCLSLGGRLLVVETRAKWHSLVPLLAQAYANQTHPVLYAYMSGRFESQGPFWVLEDGTQVPVFEDIPWCSDVDPEQVRRQNSRYSLYVHFHEGLCWSMSSGYDIQGYICEKKLH